MPEITTEDLDSVTHWYFAIGGLQTSSEALEMASAVRLQRLKTFPTSPELAFALNSPYVAGIMDHYGEEVIQHQLVVDAESFNDFEYICDAVRAILAGLRIRTEGEIFCPAICDYSWDELRGVTGNACIACRFEPHIYSHGMEERTMILPDDLEWVKQNMSQILELNKQARFATALDALCSYLHSERERMKAAQLWAGVEAIFDVQFEISYRLPILAALMLEQRGEKCRERREMVHKLYKERSKAVHGQEFNDSKNHISLVRSLLAKLLAKIIQNGHLPTKQDFDDLVLMPGGPEKSLSEAVGDE